MRKYIYITPEAANHLINVRNYQSAEFEACAKLLSFLRGETVAFNDIKIRSSKMSEGQILYTKPLNRKEGLFFDLTQYDGLIEEPDNRLITIFQKVLRASIKYFNKQTFAPNELVVGTNLVVFPFPHTKRHEAYRVLLDKNTFRKGKTINVLSVYYGGTFEHAEGLDDTVLNGFYEEFKQLTIDESDEKIGHEETLISSMMVQSLSKPKSVIQPYVDFKKLNQWLTKPQYDFIHSPLEGAKRLEGAAGTGKTLAMILKCIHHLQESNFEKRFIYITHSCANKEHIIEQFLYICPELDRYCCTNDNPQGNLLVTTIQEWCINYLGTNLAETEYLDADALESKEIQQLYIEQAIGTVRNHNYDDYSKAMSEDMIHFFEKTDDAILCEMLQYEIGVVIKGYAEGDLDIYKKLERPEYGIPCKTEVDFQYIHLIYAEYQRQLENEGRFDSDDIVLTAMSSLNAPIWRRRREIEGFDACFIDEKQLFNFNEESVLQYLNKSYAKNNIIFAIDKSQYAGEIMSKSADLLAMSMRDGERYMGVHDSTNLSTSFRSTTDIVNLAFNVMSNGATLFHNFENPLSNVSTSMMPDEEQRTFYPKSFMLQDDDAIVETAIELCDKIARKYKLSKEKILIIACSSELCKKLEKYLQETHKPYEQIISRGDSAAVKKAQIGNKHIFAGIDYVGGLEFDYVIIIGVDDKRVPPKTVRKQQNFHFSSYAWYRRLYIAISRAKFGIAILGNEAYGYSSILDNALTNGYIKEEKNVDTLFD